MRYLANGVQVGDSTDWLFEASLLDLDASVASRRLTQWLRLLREQSDNTRYFAILFGNELTRDFEVVADCGLQRDIHARMAGGVLSFNVAWTAEFDPTCPITKMKLSRDERPRSRLLGQLIAVFQRHEVVDFGLYVFRCDRHELLVFLEAHFRPDDEFVFLDREEPDLALVAERLYLALLKRAHVRSSSNWERAVHELASPLDFIYSNSDFLTRYLTRDDLPPDMKAKKLEDFGLIARLLINRLHQFRFAFAGLHEYRVKLSDVNLYDVCMPITHLWYHEATRKGIRFLYDRLRGTRLRTDEELVQFLLFNLISNAIKYSHRGSEVEVFAEERGADRIALGVANQGIEIAEDERDRIFQVGYRGEAARRADARGMGIGLSVCRQIAGVLGGSISFDRDEKGRNVFEVVLPNRRRGEA